MKLLVDEKGKEMFVNEQTLLGDINTHFGILRKEDILSVKDGTQIKTHTGHKFRVLNAGLPDLFENLRRGPAIVLLKDAGMIIAKTGISSGYRVVEAGSGSGALTSFLANIVKPTGMIYSYEMKKEFMEIAKENVKTAGLGDFVDFKNRDISKGIKESEVDVVVLDLPEPWKVVKKAEKALRFGGYLVCYLPTINQVLRLEKSLAKTKLHIIDTLDVKDEKWKLGEAARPVSMQLMHTAYLVFIRKK